MAINITPTTKIISGGVLAVAGAYELFNGAKSKKTSVKVIHYIVATGLLFGGGVLIKNGYDQNKLQPKKSSAPSIGDDFKKVVKSVASELKSPTTKDKKTNTKKEQEPAPTTTSQINEQLDAPNDQIISSANGISERVAPKVVGKVDINRIENSRKKKEQIQNKINELMARLKKIPRGFDGYQEAIHIKNQIALLRYQHQNF